MTVTRREFLQLSCVGFSALALGRHLYASAARRSIGVQLYTVREQAESNLPETLAAIRKIGYDEVELYWNVYSHPATELKKMLSDHGLRARSGHFDYDGLSGKLDYARVLGLDYVICPMLPKQMWTSADGFKQAAEQFNRWGEEAKRRDLKFGFHNHNYEFAKLADTTGFDVLMENTDPKLVALELDCYWVTQAGRDPVAMIKQYKDRVRMLHLKDRKRGFPPSQELNGAAEHFTEVGNGTIRWRDVLAAAQASGIEHLFVEQDSSDRSPLESIRISYQNLENMLA
jgi:sugar phosphate isomerase/epimerase